ncbi:hypothetical protein DIE07_29615 [Burkholderia sp. Bp9002]|nr:hypothetical protein DIE18_32405 [Burkholderia sp. Bp9125]RQR52323.1 hypothetical protein DIE19_28145 [Burkholderia sp. Bp9126]RQS04154.1 hypothetical protein DIE07_29615 [Burkholderia sp. Bp9002]
MKLDTHVHLLISKTARPDWDEIRFTLDAARRNGLDVLCICEHLDAVHYPDLLEGVFDANRVGGERLAPGVLRLESGLLLSSGAEVSLRGGGDAGVHAPPDVLRRLERQKGFYALPQLLDVLKAGGGETAVVAHHVYFGRKWIDELPVVGKQLSAIELPAKDLASREKYELLAAQLELPMVGGGDGHTWLQIGACHTEIDEAEWPDASVFSIARLKDALKRYRAEPVAVAGADRLVRMSRIYRQRLEQAAA